MATAMKSPKSKTALDIDTLVAKVRLSKEEITAIHELPMMEPGAPYLFVLTYGWAVVGYYIDRPEPLFMRICHANHFRNAGKDYGRLAREGGGSECEWRYEGIANVMVPHIIRIIPYMGDVPHETRNS